MKSSKYFGPLIPTLLIVVCAAAGLNSGGAAKVAQRTSEPASRVKGAQANGEAMPVSSKLAPGAISVPPAAAIGAAVARNLQLQSTLAWSFGGKTQRGWALYVPLIANLIGCECEVGSGEFAGQLSLWQQQHGMEATGILDASTWSQMVSTFQSRRMKRGPYPAANQLATIPVSDCYDPERPEEFRKADPESFAAYKRMVATAAADASLGLELASDGQLAPNESFFKIISAYRSREYQDQLRKQSPNSGRAGLAVNSPHFTGRAFDIYVGGEPVSTKDENRSLQTRTQVYRWLVKNASRFGFKPYFFEPWHWEYVGVPNQLETRRLSDGAK